MALGNLAPGELAAWAALALACILGITLFLVSRRLRRVEKRLRALITGAGPGADSMSLGDLIIAQGERLEITRAEVEKLRNIVTRLDVSVTRSVQCIGLVRYNPFEDTGGDQSFALGLLDLRGDGVVISSLHGRTATRFYAKPIKGGTSAMSLSAEEVTALKQAMERES
jgi:hypothetical protein